MNPYKHAVLTVCTPVEQVPLEEPPVAELNFGAGLVCPNCGGVDPVVDEVNAASVAKCPDCQHEFQLESETRKMVRTLSERRRMRRRAAISAVSGTASGSMTPQKRAEVEREAFDLLGV